MQCMHPYGGGPRSIGLLSLCFPHENIIVQQWTCFSQSMMQCAEFFLVRDFLQLLVTFEMVLMTPPNPHLDGWWLCYLLLLVVNELGYLLRASPSVHWKMACTRALDETIHQSGVKVGLWVHQFVCCRLKHAVQAIFHWTAGDAQLLM